VAISSLSDATTRLDLWLAADAAVSTGLSYSIGGRQLTRLNLPEIRGQIAVWQRVVEQYTDAARSTPPTVAPGFRVASWSGTVS